MRIVWIYSSLLITGLGLSQVAPLWLPETWKVLDHIITPLTMWGLAFIMIRVGMEFDIDRRRLREYGWDYVVAMTAATFPWIIAAVYLVWFIYPDGAFGDWGAWKESLLVGRFAAPTSAGVLFSMLAAAGLATTWLFKKTRILAIFDDLDTVLLMVPLKILIVGLRWELGIILVVMAALLWIGWRYQRQWALPTSWRWILLYAAGITIVSEAAYVGTSLLDDFITVPIHIEVLLPAFVLGMAIKHGQRNEEEHASADAVSEPVHHEEDPRDIKAATYVSGIFMVLVGLSMPAVLVELGKATGAAADAFPGWGMIAVHVLVLTVLINIGKMFPTLCYRKQATFRERLAVSIAMFPRGEVGAGILIVSLNYDLGLVPLIIAMLSLALNLLLTPVFIVAVKSLIARH